MKTGPLFPKSRSGPVLRGMQLAREAVPGLSHQTSRKNGVKAVTAGDFITVSDEKGQARYVTVPGPDVTTCPRSMAYAANYQLAHSGVHYAANLNDALYPVSYTHNWKESPRVAGALKPKTGADTVPSLTRWYRTGTKTMGVFTGRGVSNGAAGTTNARAGAEIGSDVSVTLLKTNKGASTVAAPAFSVRYTFLNEIFSDWGYYGRSTYDVHLHTPFPISFADGEFVFGTTHMDSTTPEIKITRFAGNLPPTTTSTGISAEGQRRYMYRVSPRTLIMVDGNPQPKIYRSNDNGLTWAECAALTVLIAARFTTSSVVSLSGPPPRPLSFFPSSHPTQRQLITVVAPETATTCIIGLDAAVARTDTTYSWALPELESQPLIVTSYIKAHRAPVPAQFFRYNFVTDTATLLGELSEATVSPHLADLSTTTFYNSPTSDAFGPTTAATHFSIPAWESSPSFSASAGTLKPTFRMMFPTTVLGEAHYPGRIRMRAVFRSDAPTTYLIYNEGAGFENYSLPPWFRGVGTAELFAWNPAIAKQAIWATTDFNTFTRLPDAPQPMYRLGKRRWHEDGMTYMPMHTGSEYAVFRSTDNATWTKVRTLEVKPLFPPALNEAEACIMPKYQTFEELVRKDGRPAKLNPYSGAWVCDDRRPAPTL